MCMHCNPLKTGSNLVHNCVCCKPLSYLSSVSDVLRGASSWSALHWSLKVILWCALVHNVLHWVQQTLFLALSEYAGLYHLFFLGKGWLYFALDSVQTMFNPRGFPGCALLHCSLQTPACSAPHWFLQTVLRPCAELHWVLQSELCHLWHSGVHVSLALNKSKSKVMFCIHLNIFSLRTLRQIQ